MIPRRQALLALSASVLVCFALPAAQAQTFPDHPLKLIVGFPPGTGPDVVARLVGQKLGDNLKQSVAVDNRTGAGGQIATQAVAKSPADGYSLLLGEVGSISIAPPAFSKLPYDPAKELVVLSEVVRSDFLLVVPVSSPSQTVADFMKAAKAKAERVNFATFGAGTPGHFGAEMLAEQGGFKIEPIHYRATGDAVTAIVAGDVQAAFVSTALGAAQIKSGKMRALATTAQTRSALLPEVPTFTEAALPNDAGTNAQWAQLAQQIAAAVKSPEVRQKLQDAGFTVTGTTRAEAERMVRAEAPRWAAVVKATGFKGD